jgi:DNA-directed RNA polymerase III subunit RPC8
VCKTKVADLVEIKPADFTKASIVAIQDQINAKYANKVPENFASPAMELLELTMWQVIQKIGLCICLWDILWASEGLIGHGTGVVSVNGQ